ncbi:MAG: hypothetical protein ACR2JW_13390 [Thermomicrobiales bacterium]
MATSHTHVGAHDFDFLFGSWHVVNERLTSRLTNADEWERFEAIQECWPLLGGAGNGDRMRATWRGADFEGVSLRVFNPASEQWSIYWVDNVSYELQPPVMGRFVDGVGEFYGDDQHEDTPVLARFIWSGITTDTARWEQAFSTDRGETWETNWIMTFTRKQAA